MNASMTGIKPAPVTRKQVQLLCRKVGKKVTLKADRVLGVSRETVKLVSVNEKEGTAVVDVPDWGQETAYLYMFVRLY